MTVKNIETLLPVGEKLKPLLNKSVITESDMKNVLRKRGVFISGGDKKKIVPYLTMSLLSPKEFEELQELQKTKEDSLKYRTKTLSSITKSNLNEVIRNSLVEVGEIEYQVNDCIFDSDTVFNTVNPNKMVLEYGIIRTDLNKDWASTESKYSGRIEINKDTSNAEISFVSEYTSAETEEINGLIINKVISELKGKQEIDNTNANEITSGDFTNEERFKFLLSLAKDSKNGILKFKSVRNIEIGPDKSSNVEILPSNLMLLDNSVKNIIINGEKGQTLQNIDYVTNEEFHKILILRAIQVQYEFIVKGARGTCIIEYGFPHFFRANKKSKAFEVTLNKLWFAKDSVGRNSKVTSRQVLDEFRDFYANKFKEIMGTGDEDLEQTS